MKEKRENLEISDDEYLEWKLNFKLENEFEINNKKIWYNEYKYIYMFWFEKYMEVKKWAI